MPVPELNRVLTEAAALIRDEDLHLAHLAVELVTITITVNAGVVPVVVKDVYPQVIAFMRSPLSQGAVLASLCKLYRQLLKRDVASLNYDTLLKSLLDTATEDLSKQALVAIAQCVAAVVGASSDANFAATVV